MALYGVAALPCRLPSGLPRAPFRSRSVPSLARPNTVADVPDGLAGAEGGEELQPILRASSQAPGLGHWAGRAGPWVALAFGVGLTQAQLRSRFLLLDYY